MWRFSTKTISNTCHLHVLIAIPLLSISCANIVHTRSRVAERLGDVESSKRPRVHTPQKAELVANGPKLVFCICAYMGAMSAWGSSCVASISFHSHIEDNKVLKICGARGLVCLPHAVPVLSPELCPTG
jgi:hypothetical protein